MKAKLNKLGDEQKMSNKQLEPVSAAFTHAVQQHQNALEKFGPDSPHTTEAIFLVMLHAPAWLFAEMQEIALAPRH